MALPCCDRSKNRLFHVFHRVGILLCIGMACLVVSCDGNLLEGVSDDDSYEAKMEKGLMALDDEDYDKAVELFADLRSDYPNKEEVCVYLSNAYAGMTGIDTFNLLETISDLDDTDNEGSIDMIGLLLGDAEGVIDQPAVDSKMGLLSLAQSAIETCIDSPDTDERVQVGLLGLGDAALIIADLVLADLDSDPPVIKLTEEGLKAAYENVDDIDFDGDISDEDLAAAQRQSGRYSRRCRCLGRDAGADEENDLSESLNEFLMELDPDGNGVDIPDLENYIANL